jgi:hypothetical protein
LVRCQEQERGRAEEKRQHLLKESMHPKAKRSTDFKGADNKEEQAVPYGFVEVVQHLMCTEIEEDSSYNF